MPARPPGTFDRLIWGYCAFSRSHGAVFALGGYAIACTYAPDRSRGVYGNPTCRIHGGSGI